MSKVSLKDTIVTELIAGVQLEELKDKFPNVSPRSWLNYRNEAERKKNETVSPETDFAEETTSTKSANNLAKHVCVVLVLLLLSANFFTIQEVSSKMFSIAPVTGYCVAFAITITPVAVIFTDGKMYLRIAIQFIAFCIEVICNVVVISESTDLSLKTNIAEATGLSTLHFAWITGVAVPLFALLCNVYLNQLQSQLNSN